ncbi:AAA family ATPase [Pseudomonas sp. TH10]|uniref:AAA family ATPase n=1 Tax=Pseudomonas sp. TH10 TaxID=2796376 RepID=UPI001911B3DF|nr:AAA family ATPase [Pseudomonas sp. TH10]MBK5516706.1 ATP-binding protein [Pseudomonas sp. TH10]
MRLILDSIRFVGFQSSEREATVKFSGSQTSIIFGDNGSGKTTFLKLIHAVLSKDDGALARENVNSIIISFVDEFDESHEIAIHAFMEFHEEENISAIHSYDWEEFDDCPLASTRSLSMGVDRGITIQAAAVESTDIYRFLSNHSKIDLGRAATHELSEQLASYLTRQGTVRNRNIRRGKKNELQLERDHAFLQSIKTSNIELLLIDRYRLARDFASEQIQNALFDTLAIAIDSEAETPTAFSVPSDLGAQIAAGKDRIIEALEDGPDNNFKNRIVGILANIDCEEDAYSATNNPILCQLIWNMLKELKLEKQLLNSINILIETFNYFLGEGKAISISNDGVCLTVRGEEFGLDTLSSGERHLFTFLALVVIDARDRDFLIIDEPEISLNAAWQRSLVKLLEDLAPDTQIILASHSPILAKCQPSSLVELDPYESSHE